MVTTVSSACVGGHHAIGIALRELRSGSADVVLAGGGRGQRPEVGRRRVGAGRLPGHPGRHRRRGARTKRLIRSSGPLAR
ncbi:beta-ketoacyl synthase N-terminal-like domain-containing protein [Streptomyces globisporus]|uniref:beta-ketoacyl synthase N-terminal-like domain-containing protein n=1 Tax=Streptomyces globisporus TaxID=1908 RepID=UPI002FF6B302